MKNLSIIVFVFSVLVSSCSYDNFDEPTSVITGNNRLPGYDSWPKKQRSGASAMAGRIWIVHKS